MHLRFLHVFSWLHSSFFLALNNIPLDVLQFIYPLTYWRTSWLLPDLGNCEYSCYKYPCVGCCVDINTKEYLGKYQGVWSRVQWEGGVWVGQGGTGEMRGGQMGFTLTAWFYSKYSPGTHIPKHPPKWLFQFAFPPEMHESSCCSTSSPAFGVVSVLDFGRSNRYL